MYQAPDFVKVSTRVKDVFAGYGSCPWDEFTYLSYTGGREKCKEIEVTDTLVGLGKGYQCYHSQNPQVL